MYNTDCDFFRIITIILQHMVFYKFLIVIFITIFMLIFNVLENIMNCFELLFKKLNNLIKILLFHNVGNYFHYHYNYL